MEEETEDKGAEADDEKEEDDGVDPLDAFMKGVQDEVQKIKASDRQRLGLGGGIVKAATTQPQTTDTEVGVSIKIWKILAKVSLKFTTDTVMLGDYKLSFHPENLYQNTPL